MHLSAQRAEISPEVMEKWQELVNLLAEFMQVPFALIKKIDPPEIRVLAASESTGNPFQPGDTAPLDLGWYCDTVMKTRKALVVPSALEDEAWKSGPDAKLGLISYMGLPILWPSGEIFGTICVLDNKRSEHNGAYLKFLTQCRDVIQSDLGVLEDLTGALTKQTTLLDELFSRVPEAIALVGFDAIVRRINPEFTKIFGYTEQEAVGKLLAELIAPEHLREEFEANRDRVIVKGEIYSTEVVRKRKDGSLVPLAHMGVPVGPPGNQNLAYAIFRDITERRRLENDLRRERDRLHLLLEITNRMMSRLDLQALIETLSTNLLGVLGSDHCALMLPDADSGQLRATVLYNPEGRGAIYNGMIVPLHGSISGKVFRTGKSLRFDNFKQALRDAELFNNPEGRRFYARLQEEGLLSTCCLPLISRDRVLGVLAASKRSENAYDDDQATFLGQVAHQVAIAIENALDYGRATEDRDKETEQKRYLQEEIRSEHNFGEIVGSSRPLKSALDQVSVVAPTDSTVLIFGETGTGKELVARAIHERSSRKDRSFVKFNCAAIPLGLIESELFGHEKGAFTGAVARKMGRFELAHHGTLFLDEVGDIPLELQAKLLRVLQEQEFERLGSNRTHKVDVRLIAATHRDLAAMVRERSFREDLFYRLKVFPVHIPPLRERAEDIPALVRHFVDRHARRMNKKITTIPPNVMDALVRYRWPGNIRELQNFLERAVILSPDSVLSAPVAELDQLKSISHLRATQGALAQAEREQIIRALKESNWVVGGPNGAAARLGLARTSLIYKLRKFGIDPSTRKAV